MAFRTRAPSDPVELSHDGKTIVAERGEPLAAALVAADRLVLARSPKLHRPRGPYCFRGACDGCLARVDGVPNVATCTRAARGGERIETQNVVGTRKADVLRASDFFFPKGFDHHRLLAGVPVASSLLQKLARRLAGLGTLPDAPRAPAPAARRDVEVLVVGGGEAGCAAARQLGALRPWMVDEGIAPGGSLGCIDAARAREAVETAERAGAEISSATTVSALYREPEDGSGIVRALVVGPDGVTLARASRVVLATGTHAAVGAFGNNDLPGVLSARAAALLLELGIAPGKRVAAVGTDRYVTAIGRARIDRMSIVDVPAEQVVRAGGRGRTTRLFVRTDAGQRALRVDAVAVGGEGAPALELAVQAGARVERRGGAYRPTLDEDGRSSESVWCAGSCTGRGDNSGDDGARVGDAVLRSLSLR